MRAPLTNHRIRSIASILSIVSTVLLLLVMSRCALRPAHALEPAAHDITIQAGEDYQFEASLLDSTGRPQDLTGYSYQAQARTDYTAPPFATFSTATAGNKITLRMNRNTTAANSGKRGVWDLQQTDPSGQKSYWLRGKIIVVPVVTR